MKGLYSCDIMCKLVNFMNKLFWNSVFASRMLAGTWSAYLDLEKATAHNKLRVWYKNSWLQSQKLQLPVCVHSHLSSATVFCKHWLLPKQFTEETIHFMHILCRGVSRVCTNCWYNLYNPFWNRKQYLVCHTTELSVFLSTHIEVTLNNQRHQLQFLHILH